MLRNLESAGALATALTAEVAVIGGGIAGLMLSARLARQGIHVVVLESGGQRRRTTSSDDLNIVEQAGQPYRGALEGRVRGLGGTSYLWGGAMLPFLPCDMEENTAGWSVEWPVSLADLEPSFVEIERTFALPPGGYFASERHPGVDHFILRSAKWPSFQLRNVTNTLEAELRDRLIDIWTNATVTGLSIGEDGRISRISAASRNGNRLLVSAPLVVIAAGAIESTRLLLLIDAAHDMRVFAPDRHLGRYFFDHLSTAAARIEPTDPKRLNLTFALKFERGGMRDLRIEPSPTLRRAHALPAAFAHVAALGDEIGGFAALRDVYRELQQTSGVGWEQLRRLMLDVPWLTRAVWWRIVNRRLFYPRQSKFELMLVTEQMPNGESKITLSSTERDSLGVPRARINWRTCDADAMAFGALQSRLCAFWRDGAFSRLGVIRPTPPDVWQTRLKSDSSIFHPGGTTRMGNSRATGVVDGELRTFRVPNLTVVSTSSFPTGGGANPTFMLMAFALRAANRIASEVRRGTVRTDRYDPGRRKHATT
jgi:choline dehydrogenase-like flavoprotein